MYFKLKEDSTPIIGVYENEEVAMSLCTALNMLNNDMMHLQNRMDAMSKFTFMTEQERLEYKARMDKIEFESDGKA